MNTSHFCTGKSKVAHDLAQHYGGACLSIDNVVTDVLMNPSSAVALRARQLYDATAEQYSQKKVREPGKQRKLPSATAAWFNSSRETKMKQL